MEKKKNGKTGRSPEQNHPDRETQILNVISNTTILLVSMMTETLSSVFTKLSKEMITALATGFGAPENAKEDIRKKTDDMDRKIPEELRKQLYGMKSDITKQMNEKKEQILPLLTDKRFDEGITIVEQYEFNLPKLTGDLDENSLLRYILLLQKNDEQITKMFQELLEWMKNLPQQEKAEE